MDFAIGTDIEEISRFANKTLENDEHFLTHIFTEKELEYCFSKGKPAQHLCARFCAKEAGIKALTDFGIKNVYYSDIEILNNEFGVPDIRVKGFPELHIKTSLSHSKTYATATVIILSC